MSSVVLQVESSHEDGMHLEMAISKQLACVHDKYIESIYSHKLPTFLNICTCVKKQ